MCAEGFDRVLARERAAAAPLRHRKGFVTPRSGLCIRGAALRTAYVLKLYGRARAAAVAWVELKAAAQESLFAVGVDGAVFTRSAEPFEGPLSTVNGLDARTAQGLLHFAGRAGVAAARKKAERSAPVAARILCTDPGARGRGANALSIERTLMVIVAADQRGHVVTAKLRPSVEQVLAIEPDRQAGLGGQRRGQLGRARWVPKRSGEQSRGVGDIRLGSCSVCLARHRRGGIAHRGRLSGVLLPLELELRRAFGRPHVELWRGVPDRVAADEREGASKRETKEAGGRHAQFQVKQSVSPRRSSAKMSGHKHSP